MSDRPADVALVESMGLWARLGAWWAERRPRGGTVETISKDLHRDPLIRLRKR